MTFRDISPGTHIYIDANIFVYHFTSESDECGALLDRCERRDLEAYTFQICQQAQDAVLADPLCRLVHSIHDGMVS